MLSPVDLLRIPNCGRRTVQELNEALAEKGLRLKYQGFWLKTRPLPSIKNLELSRKATIGPNGKEPEKKEARLPGLTPQVPSHRGTVAAKTSRQKELPLRAFCTCFLKSLRVTSTAVLHAEGCSPTSLPGPPPSLHLGTNEESAQFGLGLSGSGPARTGSFQLGKVTGVRSCTTLTTWFACVVRSTYDSNGWGGTSQGHSPEALWQAVYGEGGAVATTAGSSTVMPGKRVKSATLKVNR